MKIIGPAYQEALDRIVARLQKVQLTVENQDAEIDGRGRFMGFSPPAVAR
jgi:hypothetical protein